jgi:hypothetical protein
MADITKCVKKDCPRKDQCYRWTVEAEDYQSYAEFEGGDECSGFWDNLKSI